MSHPGQILKFFIVLLLILQLLPNPLYRDVVLNSGLWASCTHRGNATNSRDRVTFRQLESFVQNLILGLQKVNLGLKI